MFLKTLLLLLVLLAALAAAVAAALIWGGPGPIAPLASINEPFAKVDYSALPAPSHYTARDGTVMSWLRLHLRFHFGTTMKILAIGKKKAKPNW